MIATLIVLGILIVAAATFGLVSYNTFVQQRHTITESWRQIDVELQRRHDLIPNLIDTVKAAAAFEQATLQQVLNARATAINARHQTPGDPRQSHAETQLTGALHHLFALAENYPQLQSSRNFAGLQRELSDTENRLAAARRFYNGNVRQYNARLETLPSNLIAAIGSFQAAQYFETPDAAIQQPPRIAGAFDSLHHTPPPGQ